VNTKEVHLNIVCTSTDSLLRVYFLSFHLFHIAHVREPPITTNGRSRTIAECMQQERGELGRGTEVTQVVLARHEDVFWSGGIALTFLTSTLHGGEWSASRPCSFTPPHALDKRQNGLQSRFGHCGEEKVLSLPASNPGRPARIP
jgi:hypothetical protein